jgi:3-oxoacyl-[acyl-carrier-protein] synthase-3
MIATYLQEVPQMVKRAVVIGTGGYLPQTIIPNDHFVMHLDTTDEWIRERTGIEKRHFALAEEKTSDLACIAAKRALEAAQKSPKDIDLIIVATTTADMPFPSTAAIVQAKLGALPGAAFDVQAVCSGFVYALSVADAMLSQGMARCALVIGAEIMSRLLDFQDRGTCILFGDGAGAVVLEARNADENAKPMGILGTYLSCDGSKVDHLYVDGGLFDDERRIGHLRMQGNAVFKQAVSKISEAIEQAIAKAGITMDEVDFFIPHQANIRILRGVAQRLGLSEERIITTVAHHANTSAASIPLAWDEAQRQGRLKPGQIIVIEALGGGLTSGAVVIRL